MSDKNWWIVIERMTHSNEEINPYVIGPYSEEEARTELNSDSGIVYSLLTIDAKTEKYIAHECYMTPNPPDGEIINPE